MKKKKTAMRTRRPQNFGSMVLITIVVAAVLLIILINSFSLRAKKDELEKKEAYLLEKIDEQNERTEEIEEYKKYMQTLEYIEEMAKEKLGLVHKDEIIFEAEK